MSTGGRGPGRWWGTRGFRSTRNQIWTLFFLQSPPQATVQFYPCLALDEDGSFRDLGNLNPSPPHRPTCRAAVTRPPAAGDRHWGSLQEIRTPDWDVLPWPRLSVKGHDQRNESKPRAELRSPHQS